MNAERGADGQLPAMSPADHQRLSRPSMLPSRLSSIVIALLALLTVTPAVRASDADVAFGRLLEHCHIPAGAVADLQGRELFEAVLGSDGFLHGEAGPFDVYLYLAGDLEPTQEDVEPESGRSSRSKRTAKAKVVPAGGRALAEHLLAQGVEGLGGLVGVVERYWPAPVGNGSVPHVLAGQRFPIVLCLDSDGQAGAFDDLVALLDRAEPEYTDFTRTNGSFWATPHREAPVVRNWEAQLINLSHPSLMDLRDEFLGHGLGYYTIAHMLRRLIVFGSYGNPPPWFTDGLIDELDIQAHGEAWVGGDWYTKQTPGWYRPGWEGFVPQGQRPPPPIRGPPEDLAVTVKKSGDMWAHRTNSPERHWKELADDRDSEAPASFAFMARHESFLPRDRALARCALHLLLDVAASEQGEPDLLALLDRARRVPASGMPDSEPLPMLFARAMGGVPGVEALARMTAAQLLEELEHTELADHLSDLGAGEVLQLSDHRDMAGWLYQQYDFGPDQRLAIWNDILAIEYYRELAQWERLGEELDAAVGAALDASKGYPSSSTVRRKVAEAFRGRGER